MHQLVKVPKIKFIKKSKIIISVCEILQNKWYLAKKKKKKKKKLKRFHLNSRQILLTDKR